MTLITFLFSASPLLLFPTTLSGWLGLLLWTSALVGLLLRWRKFQPRWSSRQRLFFVLLLLISPLFAGFLGFRPPASPMLTLPGIAFDPGGTPVMMLAALPWVLAAGFLGPLAAVGVAIAAGLFFAAYGSHSIFAPLEWGTSALLVAVAVQQRFRTPLFRWLRHPPISVLMVGLLYPALFTLGAVLLAQGSLASRLDYAFVRLPTAWLAFGVPALLAGVLAELLRHGFPHAWGGQPPYVPSPPESSLETRFLTVFVPVFLILLLVFVLGDWIIAGRAARDMIEKRMASISLAVAEDLPYLLSVGQGVVAHLAENIHPDVQTPAEMRAILESEMSSLPFFQRVYVLDTEQQTLLSMPEGEYQDAMTTLSEQVGVGMAVEAAIPVQFYAVPRLDSGVGQDLSFIATVYGQNGDVAGAVIGRTTWEANPLAQSLLANLSGLEDLDGVGMLVNEEGEVLYHSPAERMLSVYRGKRPGEAALLDTVASDGSRQLVYYRPVPGTTWGVVLMVPARQAQQISLEIAAPVIGIVFLLAFGGIFFLRVSLRMITGSLQQLTEEAERIAQGQLDHALRTDGADETGRLRRAFERMRLSLKARLEELNRLLRVSQGVASNVRLEDSLLQILSSALSFGADSARVVLRPGVVPARDSDSYRLYRFGAGESSDLAAVYDERVLRMMEESGKPLLVLTNASRASVLAEGRKKFPMQSMAAVALRDERMYYGVLWIAFLQPHNFSPQEENFLSTLGGHAALAAANARLFLSAEIERERLAAILASTPDPVLVTDARDRLLLLNAAATDLLHLGENARPGHLIEEVVPYPSLREMLMREEEGQQTSEIALPDGRTFMATASAIHLGGRRIGRVCVLKDVTEFKELDKLKTEFVATVSHDLRSPLTLVRGYATMLEMVGELNPQQVEYVRKIINGVENISRLVNDLLDLGRIEAGVGLQVEMYAISDLVEAVVDDTRLRARQKAIDLQVEIAPDTPPLIEVDPSLLKQALYNLVENAIKYTPQDGKIWVRVAPQDGQVLFAVQDTGIGISPIDLPHLFEKFYRSADRQAKRQHGTGLGLAIVKSIVERHGGQVGVDSTLGEGSTFYFVLPVRQPR